MNNTFFESCVDSTAITRRITQVENAKVGFYSVGLYPISLAYNCAMQNNSSNLLLAPRPDRDLFGAFNQRMLSDMDQSYLDQVRLMAENTDSDVPADYTLEDLINRCDLVILSSNSKHIENDLIVACELRSKLNRKDVVLACLVGSFSRDESKSKSYLLCAKEPNLGFFSGFHRHGALLNPLDSFTASFCHPDSPTALLGARILDRLSPNIQVSPGIHNLEAQYIKSIKNISSIFAGYAHTFHRNNPGILPSILTILHDQCLDQAATVSISRIDRDSFYDNQKIPITELGYGAQRIEATLLRDGNLNQFRDHTFSQLTPIIADLRGSMMKPLSGKPTRNFQAGQVLAEKMNAFKRCPSNLAEFVLWCEEAGLKRGALEGLNSLQYWPEILKNYSITLNDSSMINLLYFCIFGHHSIKQTIFLVMTETRELANYCQESVKPAKARKHNNDLEYLSSNAKTQLIVEAILDSRMLDSFIKNNTKNTDSYEQNNSTHPYLEAINIIEKSFI